MKKYKYNASELKLIENISIPLGVYQFINKRVVTIALSNGFRELIGLDTLEETYEFMNKDMYRYVHPDDIAEMADAAVRFASKDEEYDVIYRQKKGEDYIIVHAIGTHVIKEDGTKLAVINYVNEGVYNTDNSDIALGFNLIHNKSFQNKKGMGNLSYDYLTGLPDMNYFFELAEAYREEAISEGHELLMIFLNLNGMQAYNQRYGYTAGDALIKEVAHLLSRTFGNYHCCRTTSDHFACYTEKYGSQRLLEQLLEDFKHINGGQNLPVRIGIYDTKYGLVGPATATDRAKIACDSCGNIFESTIAYFDEAMLKRFEDRRYIFENIDKAMSDGWIKVCYQPIVRTSNSKVCNEEALVRWYDPEKGLIEPNDFIPILEDAKIAYKLDLYVAKQVIIKIKNQEKYGFGVVPNSINLSRTDFYSCDIVEEIRKLVDESGVDRSNIAIELTESVIMDDTEFMLTQVNRFRELGFSVWLDDFGSGYSSPDLLQKIHFDVIKLDKSYIDQLDHSEDSRIIVSELIRIAKGLGSETVAEGVETDRSIDFLNEVGCTLLQGFYYSEALPFSVIIDIYKKGAKFAFENPNEAEYYSTIGNMDLYDFSFSLSDGDDNYNGFFDTMPMLIVEVVDDEISLLKSNKSYKQFIKNYYPSFVSNTDGYLKGTNDINFFNAVIKCKEDGKPVIVDIRGTKNDVVHLFIRKVASNPETGAVALSVVILGYLDNDLELRHKDELERIKQERQTYSRVTSLTGDFICIFAVDIETDHYIRYVLADDYKYLGHENEGDDFYEYFRIKSLKNVFIDDIENFLTLFTKENVLEAIKTEGIFSLNLRLIYEGSPRYTCIKATVLNEELGPQLILGLVDIDSQVRKEQSYHKNLAEMSKAANSDPLTGVKNKHAYIDAEAKLNILIEEKTNTDFAIIVFDLNGLKEINDTLGHHEGDRYIKEGCMLICKQFQHSPVFRIGGDEFVAIAQGSDYNKLNELMASFREKVLENQRKGQVVIASGYARYDGERRVSDVFDKADKEMYYDKKALKTKVYA
ncbi:diguanylate cyclase (GGDEF) domain-containing protein [Pseudobutyrivibrio sp. YE44]|uniref:sensor domain-containing diguanylate cyclase n=1 Tax=Pseudobutyrivibrio sp. YE44 TaxID=1520802 RepID=UPI00088D60A6|nr:EAL domain-containing protein [Pseudobutyrivibrio sp. YE44]SDB49542.1 diguanylate cyclase (GGDEF) domain-containing protein [Pseudobutyrivibrio sp. YE44]